MAIVWGILLALTFIGIDYYIYRSLLLIFHRAKPQLKKILSFVYWTIMILLVIGLISFRYVDPTKLPKGVHVMILGSVMINFCSKLFALVFILLDGIYWGVKKAWSKWLRKPRTESSGPKITRSQFLARSAVIASAVPVATMGFGIISGAHDYRVRRRTIYLPNLPKSFDGITIGQLSDIHSGSFFNKTAVQGGVEMFMKKKPDVVFFTGDLVNSLSIEVKEYFDIFKKVKAPMGVYSTLGNHDYGTYHDWKSEEARKKNDDLMFAAHKELGWDLLMNENRFLTQSGDKIGVLGVENWGAGRFIKKGRLDLAHQNTQDAAVKLLLSHDPSHWDAQIRPDYPDIDVTFSGHTHGFQFGIEIGDFRWSPSQYIYNQWADLYQEGNQYIYVNRGFGYIGYPGRIGITPEVTIIELKRA